MQAKLLGAVDAVTSVAQAGDDVAVLVQVVVLGAQVDVHIGVSLVHGLDAFRSGDQADALKALNKKYYVLTGNHETTWSRLKDGWQSLFVKSTNA